MINYQETPEYGLTRHIYRDLAPALATDRRELLDSAGMGAEAEETANGNEPVQVSPPRSKPRDGQSRGSHAPLATVLVVEDEHPVRETLMELLSIHDYHAITAASMEEAEEAMQRLGVEGIHLIIADIHLTPGRQVRAGYALAQRWRAQQPGLPFILISGDSSNQDLPDVRAGEMRFLLKPFRMEVFIRVVREALGR